MKRTKLLLGLAALGIWTLAMGQQPRPAITEEEAWKAYNDSSNPLMPESKVPGRFALLPASYNGVDGILIHGLFRLDTMTGQVWQLSATKFKTKDPEGFAVQQWNAVSETGATLLGYFMQEQAEREAAKGQSPKPKR